MFKVLICVNLKAASFLQNLLHKHTQSDYKCPQLILQNICSFVFFPKIGCSLGNRVSAAVTSVNVLLLLFHYLSVFCIIPHLCLQVVVLGPVAVSDIKAVLHLLYIWE